MRIKYSMHKELVTPWVGKPYMAYWLIKHFEIYKPIFDGGGSYWTTNTIFKSKDKEMVERFLNELNNKEGETQ